MTASLTEYDLANSTVDYVTFSIADQLFGVPVTSIHDVFTPTGLAPVPLANRCDSGRFEFARSYCYSHRRAYLPAITAFGKKRVT